MQLRLVFRIDKFSCVFSKTPDLVSISNESKKIKATCRNFRKSKNKNKLLVGFCKIKSLFELKNRLRLSAPNSKCLKVSEFLKPNKLNWLIAFLKSKISLKKRQESVSKKNKSKTFVFFFKKKTPRFFLYLKKRRTL